MNVADLANDLGREAATRHYVRRLEIVDQGASLLKARLYISSHLFVQVYRNDRFETTNFVLVHNGRRIYARDQLQGIWHRHPMDAPHAHDTSVAGSREVTLSEFLDEIEALLAQMDLP
jgi:hypothetical protein